MISRTCIVVSRRVSQGEKTAGTAGSSLSSTNEQPSRRRLIRVEKKLSRDPKLREEYEDQLDLRPIRFRKSEIRNRYYL